MRVLFSQSGSVICLKLTWALYRDVLGFGRADVCKLILPQYINTLVSMKSIILFIVSERIMKERSHHNSSTTVLATALQDHNNDVPLVPPSLRSPRVHWMSLREFEAATTYYIVLLVKRP
jgi:hypothetical protein